MAEGSEPQGSEGDVEADRPARRHTVALHTVRPTPVPDLAGLTRVERRLGMLAAAVIFNVVLSNSFQEALFLSNHAKDDIPLAMLLGSLVTAATTLSTSRLFARRSPAGALRAILGCLAALAFLGFAWNIDPSGPSTFALFLFVEMSTTLGEAATWSYFQAPLEPSQIRRLLPRLGIYAGLGGLGAGLLIPVVLSAVSAPQALVLISGLSWVAAAFLVRMDHVPAPVKARRARVADSGKRGGMRQVLALPLTRWLILGTAGILWIGLCLQYQTRVALQRGLTPPSIARVMGLLLALSSLAGIAVQGLLTGRVLERYGVGLALAILPAAVATLLGAYTLLPGILIIGSAFFLNKALRPNLHRPAESCLVAALPPPLRPTMLLLLGAVLTPLLKAGGALLLLFLLRAGRPEWLLGSALGTALLLVLLAPRWGDLYTRSLRATLLEGSIEPPDAAFASEALVPALDGPRLGVLLEAIDGARPRSRELALELLRPHRSERVAQAMEARLDHPSEAVRITALHWLANGATRDNGTIGARRQERLLSILHRRFALPDLSAQERIALLEAAGPSAPALLGADLSRFTFAPDLELRSAVLHALLCHGDREQKERARGEVEALLLSPKAAERCAGLLVGRQDGDTTLLKSILPRLDDEDLNVRREAAACLAPFLDQPEARAGLWRALEAPRTAYAAARALHAAGPAAVPAIIDALGTPATPREVRLHLLRALGLIGLTRGREGMPALLSHLSSRDREIQKEALKSLNRLRRGDPGPGVPVGLLRDFVLGELRFGLHLLQCKDLLRSRLRQNGLLLRELTYQIDQVQQRATLTLELLCTDETMVHVLRTLRSPGAVHRDQARELLRTLFREKSLQAGVLKLLEEVTPWSEECFRPPLEASVGRTISDAMRWLGRCHDPWILAAVRHDRDAPPIPKDAKQTRDLGEHPRDRIEDPMEPTLDLILFLKDVALFEALSNQQLVAVARLAEPTSFPAGHRLFAQGDAADALYLVREGKLRVLVSGQEVARLGAGECAGEMAVLAATARSGTVEAVETSQLLRFDGQEFLALLESYPEIGRGLIKSLVRRLARAGIAKGQRPATMVGLLDSTPPSET